MRNVPLMTPFHQASVVCTALALLGLATPALAQDSDPLTDLRSTVTEQSERLKQSLQSQQERNTESRAWHERAEQRRKLRAMHREAVLLSELNVAWIDDQLDHWDCRVAEQAAEEVNRRIAELDRFNQRIDSLCASLQADDQAQQQVCARQRDQAASHIDQLRRLAERYHSQCPNSPTQ